MLHVSRVSGWMPLVCLIGLGLFRDALMSDSLAEDLNLAARDLRGKQAAELEELAVWCTQNGLAEQAERTRGMRGPHDPNKLYLPVLPTKVGRPELPEAAKAEVVEWDKRLAKLQRDHGNALYELARRAIHNRHASLAIDLVLDAIRTNPNHEAVRRLLGYQSFRGEWHTAFEVGKLRSGQVWHEKFGWIPNAHVARYEAGQRLSNGRWISADDDAKLHRNIESGWTLETEHYLVLTNHSREAGVHLGVKLERLFHLWQQIFVRYFATEADVVALFDGRARANRTPVRCEVVFFRDRDDYNRALRATMPDIEVSIGFYLEQTRRAYFFSGEDYSDRTLYHEATHQLFHQARPVPPGVGSTSNFWIVEGIALFMESLRHEGDHYSLGGFDDERLYAARYRLLEDGFYIPLAELTTYGMTRLQKHPRVATLYSQAAGLTHFLMFYDGGRYRDALVAYLSAVYSGRDTANTLSELTGTPYDELDRQYRRFLQIADGVPPDRGNP